MHSPTSHFDRRIRRSRILSWWYAWWAVHGSVFLDDYLIFWLRYYQAQYRWSHNQLPFDLVIDHGLKVITNSEYEDSWAQIREDPTDEEASEIFQSLSMIEEITRQVQELDEEDAWLTRARHEIREQQQELQDEEVDAIGTGEMRGPTTKGRQDRCRRRPRLPFPWIPVLGYLAIAVMTMVEAFQFAQPFLDMIGVDTTRLGREWEMNPIGVLGGAGFALVASSVLFFLCHLLLQSVVTLSSSWDSAAPGVIMRRVAYTFCLCCGLLAGTYLIATMRHGMTNDVTEFMGSRQSMGNGVFFFLTLLVPCAAAYIHHKIGQSPYCQRRREIIAEQKQWDRAEEERLVPAETLADRMNLILRRRDWIEEQRALLRARRSVLADRAQAAQQQRPARLKHARRTTEAYARSLLAALEQDKMYFIRAAHRCKALHLVPEEARAQSMARPQPRPFVRPLLTAARNGQGS